MRNNLNAQTRSVSANPQKKKKKILKTSIGIAAAAVVTFLLLGRTDAVIFLQWEFYMLLMMLASMPLAVAVFGENKCLLPFGKTFGVLIPGFMMWVAGVCLHMPFTRATGIIAICLYFMLCMAVGKKQKRRLEDWKQCFSGCLRYEVIFFVVFLFWAYLIGFNPSGYGTEKFMDYGFLQKMLTTSKLPPDDIWYAGKSINYYYGGQYYAAFIAKTMLWKTTKAEYAYNMMRALIPALMFTGIFGIAEQMLKDRFEKISRKESVIFSALSAAAVVFGGNGHYIVYGLLKPFISIGLTNTTSYTWHKDIDVDSTSYWFPDATRYIGYNPDVDDKTIHEFPCYSFVLGDLHAHMVNIMIVILIAALLYAFLKENSNGKKKFCLPQLCMLGLAWGLCNFTNYWDYIIYAVVIIITIIFGNLHSGKSKMLKRMVSQFGIVLITGYLTALPFTMNFKSIFKGVGVAEHHSAVHQLIILWGIPVAMAVLFIALTMYRWLKAKDGLIKRLQALRAPDVFAFIMCCCAIGLIAIPELVYVRDIYEGSYSRANTMFKLTYQAFILLNMCSGYVLYSLLQTRKKPLHIAAFILLALQILLFGYFFNAAGSWFGVWMNPMERTGLNALNYLDNEEFADEKDALLWLKDKAEKEEIKEAIAEATGDSYTAYERVSVITGISTPAGWKVHEWLWRDSLNGIEKRTKDIDGFFDGTKDAEKIIKKYNIKYVFCGLREVEKYGKDVKDRVRKMGKVVYEKSGAMVVEVN